MPQPRLHYMDSMRSVLMLLGVFLHAANIYSAAIHWYVHDSQTSALFDLVSASIHTFRMPTFFIIAGFFALLTLKKYRAAKFFKMRMRRITIPLVATAVLINTLEAWLRSTLISDHPQLSAEFWGVTLPATWTSGQWVEHLWFLIYLIAYFSICVGVYKHAVRWAQNGIVRRLAVVLRHKCRFLLLAPLVPIAIAAVSKMLPGVFYENYLFGTIELIDLLEYLPFFLFGMWLYDDETLQASFGTVRPWHVAVLPLAVAGCWLYSETVGVSWQRLVGVYSTSLLAWLGCLFCFAFFRKFVNHQSPLFSYLADASYSIYLFHHLFVVLIGALLVSHDMPLLFKYLLVVGLTFLITLGIHHFIIRRYGLMRLLFNGK